MSGTGNIRILALVTALGVASVVDVEAQNRPQMRNHTATETKPLQLASATQTVRSGSVQITTSGSTRTVKSNGVPDHAVGRFPNRGNPNRIKAQSYSFKMTTTPQAGSAKALSRGLLFGVAVNGVPFDPGAAEFWKGNPQSGWQYEALGGAVRLGLDENFGHVQPTGAYHYHGLPVGLMNELGWSSQTASPLIGYAADGFPIYAITANIDGPVRKLQSSYRLKSGNRPGGAGPTGEYDGTFVQDYTYVEGAGDLDQCNGANVKTSEYPNGTYAYFLTDSYPVIPRCLVGQADRSFSKRRR
ncbi:MAG: YHYH protein [Cognatishimia sp.]|uniref:YHYH protein n=1 Tax=Cognatishimia sp. TaxID=2211648 RepID=UPI003B8B4AF7